MADPTHQKQILWLNAMRAIGYHFSKIGDVISKYAEDADKFTPTPPPHSGTPHTPPSYTGIAQPHSNARDDESRWQDGPRAPKQIREPRNPRDIRPLPHTAVYTDDRPAEPPTHKQYRGEYETSPRHSSAAGAHQTNRMADRMVETHEHPSANKSNSHSPSEEAIPAAKRRRRTSSAIPTDSDEPSKQGAAPQPSLDTTRPSAFKAKSIKRVRINWSQSENKVFFNTITKHATQDESTVLKEIVTALNGSRNWVQCKGHFRNLQYVGRISQTSTTPKRWLVVENQTTKSQKTSPGTKPSSSAPGGKGDADVHDSDRAVDSARHLPALMDFDTHAGGATTEDKSNQVQKQDRANMHEEEDEDVDEDHDEEYGSQSANKETDVAEARNAHHANGHVSRKGGKSVRGMRKPPNGDSRIFEPHATHHDATHDEMVSSTYEPSDLQTIADQTVHDLHHVNDAHVPRVKSFESRDMAIPLKKQQAPAQMSLLPSQQIRPRDSRDKRRYTDIRPNNTPQDVATFTVRK